MIEDEDKQLLRTIIENYQDGFFFVVLKENNDLLWKDMLLYFKRIFLVDIHTSIISKILRELLNIDQELHVRSGIKLSFQEWMNMYMHEEK
jgi:hypothetical protein